ncbi:hypothetical protein LCGC14_1089010 [marine sediment metagenome]|uniref:Uncharacterized protein n=1 Tax=marine sediment metagenome TaxID=412755 RepID=A0A0F9N0J5_9ZZZZ
MSKHREAKDLTPQERKRIVEGWRAVYCQIADIKYLLEIAADLNVHEDTIQLVLREEGE